MIDRKNIQAYNSVRQITARNLLCHAPFVNLNFEQNGNITACCYNRSHVLGKYPENSVEEAWFGEKAKMLREYIRNNDLSGGCSACEQLLNSGNYSGTKAIFYDEYADTVPWMGQLKRKLLGKPAYPKVLEFEISNLCNLECTMCNGYFSSAIRKNREHLPDLANPYDDGFIAQIKKFIPHLTDAKFLGGEPFLIDLYYKIWDAIIELKPAVKAHITTNGTILNGRIKEYLEKLSGGIIVSLDSINKTTYEKIRVNANYERVIANVHYFIELARRKNTYLSIAACPIKANRMESLPGLVRFCNEHDIYLHFNTVWTPESESLRFLSQSEFSELISFLEKNDSFRPQTAKQVNNVNNYRGVISQVKYWSGQNNYSMIANTAIESKHGSFPVFSAEELKNLPAAAMNILLAEMIHYHQGDNTSENAQGSLSYLKSEKCSINAELPLEENLHMVHQNYGDIDFLKGYCISLSLVAAKTLPISESSAFNRKADALSSKFETINHKTELISELIRTGFMYLFNLVNSENMATVNALIDARFNQAPIEL